MGAPIVTVTSVDTSTVTKVVPQAHVTFTFDTDVIQWVVCAGGTAPFFGTVITSGTGNKANQPITVTISLAQLSQGSNRINIYGLNGAGQWTPYNDDRSPTGHLFINALGASVYGQKYYG